MKCDVLVVGAGPAGSGAGLAAAKAGARTLVIDRKKEIGTPVQCGEVVGLSILQTAGITLPPKMVCARHEYTRFVVDRKFIIDNRSPYWRSVTVERKMFDKHLAMEAARSGASVQADCRLTDVEMDHEEVRSVVVRCQGKDIVIRPKAIVAADGVHSTMGKLLGRPEFKGEELARGVEYEMVAEKRLPPCMQMFIEPEIGLGYGWIIPKGPFRANVGLGLVGRSASRREFLLDWIMEHPIVSQYFTGDKILEVKTGDAPVPGFDGGPVQGNVLFAGDSAGQTLAFVGEGIMPSYICGKVAGRIAAEAVKKKKMDFGLYDEQVRGLIGEEMDLGTQLRDALVIIWSLSELSDSQKSIASALVMNELVSEDDIAMIDALPADGNVSGLVRDRIRSSGKPIRMKNL